ncbi:MAG: pilus assembly protein [Proteobacteria bacterium]|nr:pilus assembly protein [Pseudomonadota bacterium]
MSRPPFSTRSHRRGASAVEFALTLPIFMAMVMGLMDYGWFFAMQAQTMSALSGAMRAGSHIAPDEDDRPGGCIGCVGAASAHAVMALESLGHEVAAGEVTPSIRSLEGTCALVLDVTLDHDPIVGFVPIPDDYAISVNALLLHVDDC